MTPYDKKYGFFLACGGCYLLKQMLILTGEHHVLSEGAVFLLALPLGLFSALAIFPVGAIVGLSGWPNRGLFAIGMICLLVDLTFVLDTFFGTARNRLIPIAAYMDISSLFSILVFISVPIAIWYSYSAE